MDRVHSLRKIPMRLRGTNFCTSSASFAPSFVRQPNGLECTQIVLNAPKRQLRVQWGVSGPFVAKKFRRDFVARTFALVRPVSHRVSYATKQPRMHQIVRNASKHKIRVQWGGSDSFVAKNSDASSWHELLD